MRSSGVFLFIVVILLLGTSCEQSESTAPLVSSYSQSFSNVLPVAGSISAPYYAEQIFADFSEDPPRFYHEKIWVSEDGRCRCICSGIDELIHGIRVPCSQGVVDSYNRTLLYGSRSRFVVFDRGFRIKDIDLFLQNYNFSILHPSKSYLNRDTLVVRVTSRQMDRPGYTVWLDKHTGFVLKYSEDTLAMDPLSTLEVTKLDLNPDFAGVEFAEWDREEEILDEIQLAVAFDFNIYEPLYLPDGFSAEAPVKWTIKRRDGDIVAFKLSYTDGLQTLSMIQTAPLGVDGSIKGPRINATRPEAEDITGASKILHRGGKLVVRENTGLNVHSKGGMRSFIFQVEGTAFTLRAKVHEEDLMTLIYSMLPVLD